MAELADAPDLGSGAYGVGVRLPSPAPGGIPEWPKGADCKSVVSDFGGSNPPPSTRSLRDPIE